MAVKTETERWPSEFNLPITPFADDFNFEVVYATRCRNRVCSPHTSSVFVILSRTYSEIQNSYSVT